MANISQKDEGNTVEFATVPTSAAKQEKLRGRWNVNLKEKCKVHMLMGGAPQEVSEASGVPTSTLAQWKRELEALESEKQAELLRCVLERDAEMTQNSVAQGMLKASEVMCERLEESRSFLQRRKEVRKELQSPFCDEEKVGALRKEMEELPLLTDQQMAGFLRAFYAVKAKKQPHETGSAAVHVVMEDEAKEFAK